MIIPALDLLAGNVVRLRQGEYAQRQDYSADPLRWLRDYQAQGAQWLHLVDLDGAKDPTQRQHALLNTLLAERTLAIQVGGGIRSEAEVEALLNAGARRVVIGSLAALAPRQVADWLRRFGPDALVLALDVRIRADGQKELAVNGWQTRTPVTLEQRLSDYAPYGLKHVLCTDISRDGMLSGPNLALWQELTARFPSIEFQASGGVSGLADIAALRRCGVPSVIVGRALLENRLQLAEAIACWQNG